MYIITLVIAFIEICTRNSIKNEKCIENHLLYVSI